MKAIRFASADHLGWKALIGVKLSCNRSLPSTLLRQRFLPDKRRRPPRRRLWKYSQPPPISQTGMAQTGGSLDRNAPARREPVRQPHTASYRLCPVQAGTRKFMGPEVNATGWRILLGERAPFSGIAHILVTPLRVAWKTKYLPFGVHSPQHSSGGRFQLASQGWS